MKIPFTFLFFVFLFPSFFPSLFAVQSMSKKEKMNACFITINSSEEKHIFKEKLSTGKNKGKFNFHEFVPAHPHSDWFKEACKKNIRCDLLIISGHFGGGFFGSSNVSLTMDQLEKRSCKNDCEGIVSSPKEVFLLGCNTLAGKKEDNRSAAEYLDVLVGDNIPVEQAARIVEQRYGLVGTSFHHSMRRVFKGVPHIYGFHSIAPSGKNIEPLLKKYHKKIPRYYDHLLRIEVERGLALMGDFTKWNTKNNHIEEALKITHFSQTSGVLTPCISTDNKTFNSPIHSIMENICKFRSEKLSDEEALETIKDLLLDKSYPLYLPIIGEYLEGKDSLKKRLLTFIKRYPQIKKNILSLLENTQTGFGKLKVAKMAFALSLLSQEEFNKIEKSVALSYLKPPVSVGSKDAICSYYIFNGLDSLEREDIDDALFRDPNGLLALQCLHLRDRRIISKIMDTAENAHSLSLRITALYTLYPMEGKSFLRSPQVISFLKKQMKEAKTEDERVVALLILSASGQGNSPYFFNKIKELMKSHKKIKLLNNDVYVYELALSSLGNTSLRDYDHFKEFFTVWKDQNISLDSLEEDFIWVEALRRLKERDIFKFLEDESISSKKEKKRLIESLFKSYRDFDSNDLFPKIPSSLYIYAFENHLSNGIFNISIKNKEEERSLISHLKKRRLSFSELESLALSLSKNIYDAPLLKKYLLDKYGREALTPSTIEIAD